MSTRGTIKVGDDQSQDGGVAEDGAVVGIEGGSHGRRAPDGVTVVRVGEGPPLSSTPTPGTRAPCRRTADPLCTGRRIRRRSRTHSARHRGPPGHLPRERSRRDSPGVDTTEPGAHPATAAATDGADAKDDTPPGRCRRPRPRSPHARPRPRPDREPADRISLGGEWPVLIDDHDPPYPGGVALEADDCAREYGRSHYEHADPPDGRPHWSYDTA